MSTTITIEIPEIECGGCGTKAQAPAAVLVAAATPGYGPGAWIYASDGSKWRVVPSGQPPGWLPVGVTGVRCKSCLTDAAIVAQAAAGARVLPDGGTPAAQAAAYVAKLAAPPPPPPKYPEPAPPSAMRHGVASIKDVGGLPSAPIRAGSPVSSIPIPPQRNQLVSPPVAVPTAMPAKVAATQRYAGIVRPPTAAPIVMAPAPAPVVSPNVQTIRQEGQPIPHLPPTVA